MPPYSQDRTVFPMHKGIIYKATIHKMGPTQQELRPVVELTDLAALPEGTVANLAATVCASGPVRKSRFDTYTRTFSLSNGGYRADLDARGHKAKDFGIFRNLEIYPSGDQGHLKTTRTATLNITGPDPHYGAIQQGQNAPILAAGDALLPARYGTAFEYNEQQDANGETQHIFQPGWHKVYAEVGDEINYDVHTKCLRRPTPIPAQDADFYCSACKVEIVDPTVAVNGLTMAARGSLWITDADNTALEAHAFRNAFTAVRDGAAGEYYLKLRMEGGWKVIVDRAIQAGH